MGHLMRVRLDEETARLVLALDLGAWQDEPVEVTTHQEDTVVQPVGKIKTCPACGVTGTIGSTFYESNPSLCKPCTTTRINEHIHRVNEATRATAENHRQPWTELEVEMLLGAVSEGMHAKDIAEMLGRTYLSVHGKLSLIRKLEAEGRSITYASYTVTTETTTTVTVSRDPNYVASAPDEDRWWEASYYTKESGR